MIFRQSSNHLLIHHHHLSSRVVHYVHHKAIKSVEISLQIPAFFASSLARSRRWFWTNCRSRLANWLAQTRHTHLASEEPKAQPVVFWTGKCFVDSEFGSEKHKKNRMEKLDLFDFMNQGMLAMVFFLLRRKRIQRVPKNGAKSVDFTLSHLGCHLGCRAKRQSRGCSAGSKSRPYTSAAQKYVGNMWGTLVDLSTV